MILPACALVSAFTNNTPIVAVMIPFLQTWSIKAGIPLTMLLMPMSFAVILGGLCTIIGTSANLVIQGLAQPLDLGFFTVGAMAGPYCIVGVAYLIIVAPLVLPKKTTAAHISQIFAWHKVAKNGRLTGQKVEDVAAFKDPGSTLLWIKYAEESNARMVPGLKGKRTEEGDQDVLTHQLSKGDMLLVVGFPGCVEVCCFVWCLRF